MKTNTSLFFYESSSCSIERDNSTKEDPTSSMFADYYPGEDGALKKCPVVIFSERASLSRGRMPRPDDGNTEFNSDSPYRYGYQGQERDPETGKEAFQLRLYDSRINRWLTTDPAGQYSSPYLAMGNNWISRIDPDGGYDSKWKQFWGWAGNGFQGERFTSENTGNLKYGIDIGKNGGIDQVFSQNGFDAASQNWKYHHDGGGFVESGVSANIPNFGDRWSGSQNILSKISYDAVNQPWIAIQAFNPFDNQVTHLNGSGATRGEIANEGILGLTSLASFGFGKVAGSIKSLKSSPALYNQFSKSTKGLFKGANHSLLRSRAYKEMIKVHNNFVKEVKHINVISKGFQDDINFTGTILED